MGVNSYGKLALCGSKCVLEVSSLWECMRMCSWLPVVVNAYGKLALCVSEC